MDRHYLGVGLLLLEDEKQKDQEEEFLSDEFFNIFADNEITNNIVE